MAYLIRMHINGRSNNAQRRAVRAAVERHVALLQTEMMLIDDRITVEPTIMVRDTPARRRQWPKGTEVAALLRLPWIDPDFVEPEET